MQWVMSYSKLKTARSIIRELKDETESLLERIEQFEKEGREDPEPECRCYCVGDQADASNCKLHGGNR